MTAIQKLYITGISKPAGGNPISQRYGVLFLGFLVDANSGVILDVEVNAICAVTSSFLSQLLVGLSFDTQMEEMLFRVQKRYLGHSQKSILVAIKHANSKWIRWKSTQARPV